jgi:hypothetical protein
VVLWRGFTRWEDYLTLLRTRRVLAEDQRRRRRLEALAGPLRFAVDDLGSDVLPTCFDWKSARDRAADRAELFASEAPRRFFGALDYSAHDQRCYGYPYPIKAAHDRGSLTEQERTVLRQQLVEAAVHAGMRRSSFRDPSQLTGHR